jgi:hypothetical protein
LSVLTDFSLIFADLPPENETNGYIFIHAEGGLNQQRIAVWIHSLK